MTRREVIGALLAIFGGIALPEPLRPQIRIASNREIYALFASKEGLVYPYRLGDAWQAFGALPTEGWLPQHVPIGWVEVTPKARVVHIDRLKRSITLDTV